ncbi:threonine aldolase family protein [Pinisolibacter sp.]|uniref:threonine aldolase family protein n=1 Tax=Pinisolibacter sp. TaxID=2172024 RepID=UPI002FDC7DC9
MIFSSDNWFGASPKVLAALAEAGAVGPQPAYGDDEFTRRLEARFAAAFERDVDVFLVATGTAANALSVATFAPPWGQLVIHEEGHLAVDECGAPEFFAGTRTVTLPGRHGKIDARDLGHRLAAWPIGVHHGKPAVLSIAQANESGRIYTPAEVAALADVAHRHGLALHMDGARLANAVARLGCSLAEVTWKAGVDVLSFGATKGGCLMAEAIVSFDSEKREELAFRRKRAGQLISKHRLVAAQFDAWLDDGHWLELAAHANAMTDRLAAGIARSNSARLAWEPQANEVFVAMAPATAEHLTAAGARFHPWSTAGLAPEDRLAEGEALYRLVTSFATTTDDVDAFLAELAKP